jgi:hypothetical protein
VLGGWFDMLEGVSCTRWDVQVCDLPWLILLKRMES